MKNRAIISIMIILILLPCLPKPSYGKGQVMEIDALFGDFKLQVEGWYFPHKEIFIYDGELWVPMKEVAEALDLGYSFNSNNRTLWLNSYGKLNIDDLSIETIAYQRGYEIQAMKRKIAEIDNEIREFQGRRDNSPSKWEGEIKNIRVGFSDIDIFLDGKKVYLDRKPLIYRDDVYVSLISLSPLLYITPEFNGNRINIDGNGILVEKTGYNDINRLVSHRNSLRLREEKALDELEKKKRIIMDVKIPYEEVNTLKDMKEYLNKHLDSIGNLEVEIDLRDGSDSWYYLDISFDSLYRWRRLTRLDVETYIWDIFVAITSLYDEDAKIQGQIRYSNRSRYNYVEFNTQMRNIVFKFIDSGLDMTEKVDPQFIEDLLRKELDRYYRVYFDYSARISGYDLELTVYPDDRSFMDNWSLYSKISFLERIDSIISRYYPGLRINGIIEYPFRDSIEFLIDEGKIRSPYLERETEEFLGNRYGSFTSGELRIPMEYKLHQTSFNDYKLLVYMDFNVNDERWNDSLDRALDVFLHDLISEVIGLWDVNVFLQAFDVNQYIVKEIVISQDTVQMVIADPPPGEVTKGTTITLYTNTTGANVYYTLDGSAPSPSNRTPYTGPIKIEEDTVIRAYATKEGMNDSPISSFEYKVVDDEE